MIANHISINGMFSLFFLFWAIFTLGCSGSVEDAQESPSTGRYNVLFIVVDDLNDNIGSYGHEPAKTPHIDRLAARGVQFDRAYVQYPLCNPSRTSFLSGLRPETTQIFTGQALPRRTIGDRVMLPEYFDAHGYFTARVGKIAHSRFPDSVSWDVSENAPYSPFHMPGIDESTVRDNTWIAGAEDGLERLEILAHLGRTSGLPLSWRALPQADDQTPDGGTARRIADLMRAHKDERFFIAAGFHKPHQPWIAPTRYFRLHPPGDVDLPQEPEDDRNDIPLLAIVERPDDALHTDAQKRQAIAAYNATISLVDSQVGLLLDTLDELGLAENTFIVFFSDHGFLLGEHGGMWRKTALFEEATRVPLIVAGPGIEAGRVSPRLVELVDLYPTLAQLCGLPVPDGLEGTDFAPLLADPDREWKRGAFSMVMRGDIPGRSVRTERYRYSEWGEEGPAELYDLAVDPGEFENRAGDEAFANEQDRLRKLLHAGWTAALPPAN
ncbi:MAG: sulfatase [Gammaproteobacteria bacterium]|nr:sulfatase [Gammaproteobacteria bacterium]